MLERKVVGTEEENINSVHVKKSSRHYIHSRSQWVTSQMYRHIVVYYLLFGITGEASWP